MDFTSPSLGDQRPLHRVAKTWSQCKSWGIGMIHRRSDPNGLSSPSVGDQRPHHSVAKQGHFAGQVSRNAPAGGCNQAQPNVRRSKQQSVEKTILAAHPFNRWRIQDQSHAARQNSNTAAIPSKRSLQLRVNRAPPPRGRQTQHPSALNGAKRGCHLSL